MSRRSPGHGLVTSVFGLAAAVALVLPALGALLGASAAPAAAAAGTTPPPYVGSQTFTFPGFTDQTFTVPPAVTQVFIEALGGSGGNGGGSPGVNGGAGGAGADIGVQVGVVPGQVFTLHVGLKGKNGFDNGGDPGVGGWVNDRLAQGGDGGYSDITISNTAAGAGGGGAATSVVTNGSTLLVAGGGGGGGGGGGIVGYHGGAGGSAGTSPTGGTGGTGPGAGSGGGTRACLSWAGSYGGSAASYTAAGGGGGGGAGYAVTSCGGAGGNAGGTGAGGGGGGGAGGSYVDDNVVFVSRINPATTTGDGSITFTWGQPTSKTHLGVAGGTSVDQWTTLTASVQPAGSGITTPTPTGTVDFYDGTTLLGSSDLSNGVATLWTGTLGGGTHSLRAAYRGDTVYASSSGAATLSTAKATPLLSGGANAGANGIGSEYAQVGLPNTGVTGAPAPTGSVHFEVSYNGGLFLDEGTHPLDTSNPPQVTLPNQWQPGNWTERITYLGDANYLSTSTQFTFTVSAPKAATSTALTSSLNPSKAGQAVTFTATVTGSAGPTGTVTFVDGSTPIGTGIIGSGGKATLTTSALPQGTHTIAALYGGDASSDTSTSPPLSQTVNAAAAPHANAGPDQSVASGATTTVDGSGSTDPQGEPLTYTWDEISGPAVTFDDRHAAKPHVTVPTGPGTVTLRLTVTNGAGLTGTDTVVLTVKAPK